MCIRLNIQPSIQTQNMQKHPSIMFKTNHKTLNRVGERWFRITFPIWTAPFLIPPSEPEPHFLYKLCHFIFLHFLSFKKTNLSIQFNIHSFQPTNTLVTLEQPTRLSPSPPHILAHTINSFVSTHPPSQLITRFTPHICTSCSPTTHISENDSIFVAQEPDSPAKKV